jgi:hypothetical protein
MKIKAIAIAALSAVAVTAASAQAVSLVGQYRCVQDCRWEEPAYITQNGSDLNLVNEIGQSSRAWIDRPGHIWADNWKIGAVYSADGNTIQFDSGSVWVRDLGPSSPPPSPQRKGH